MATKADIDRWIAAQGGPDAVSHSYEDVEVPDPRGERKKPDGTDNDDYDRAFKDKKISTRREVWTNKTTGASYSAMRTPFTNDQFEDIKETAPSRAPSATGSQAPAGTIPRIEGTPRGDGTFDNEQPIMVFRRPDGTFVTSRPLEAAERTKWEQDRERSRNPGGRTDAQLPARSEQPVPSHPGYTQVTVKDPTTNSTRTFYVGPDGKETNSLPPAPTAAKPEQDGNGNWGYWDTKPGQPPTWVPIQGTTPAGESPKPVEVNGVWGVWKPGQNGGPPTFETVQVPQAGAGLKNVDPFVPDYTKPDLGLADWATKQRQKIGKPADQGGITQKEYDDAVTTAHASATTTIQNVTAQNNVRRQAVEDERVQAARRVAQSQADATAGEKATSDIWKYTKPGSAAIMGVTPYTMALRRGMATVYGDRDVPAAPLHPMFQGLMNQAGVGGATPPAAVPGGSAIGPVGAGVTATTNAAVNPTRENVDTAIQATTAGTNAAMGALGIPPVPASPSVADAEAVRQQHAASGQPLPAPLLGPPPAVAPQSSLMPSMDWLLGQTQPSPEPAMPQPEQPVASIQGLMQPRYDPRATAQRLLRIGVPMEAVTMAMQQRGYLG
jgi:hypothetical protein